MRTLSTAFALAVAMVSIVATCEAQQTVRADAAYGVVYTQEQVIQLPQDQGRFYLSVFGSEGEYRYEQVKNWMASDPQLAAVRAQTIYNTYRTDSVMYRDRYAQGVGNIPCVRLQNPQGVVIYEVNGTNVPMSAEAMYNGITEACRRRRCCPQPPPHVTPTPPVAPQPSPIVRPEPPKPAPAPVVHDFPNPWMWVGLVCGGLLLGGCVSFGVCFKKDLAAKK